MITSHIKTSFVFIWLFLFSATLIWSSIQPSDRLTWLLEVLPAIIAVLVLAYTYRTFPLTPVNYFLILCHCIILMIGGHYTYAEVPLFNDLADVLNTTRNNYDKLGHFAQGFVPALVAREIFIRLNVLKNTRWMIFSIICFCLAFSAFYELIEWWVALLADSNAQDFLGTQGYIWDTQSDMAWALIGAISSLVLLSRIHDKQLGSLNRKTQHLINRRRLTH
ncbi:MAG: DUF2238 domain-containing protein [Cycloclasticus sp.]|nr:DUF2238 domain-containing protein [Cycloclasticus sp.]